MRRLDVVIPGAQKAGTTSLLDTLAEHSAITRHATEEFPALVTLGTSLEREVARAYPGPGITLAKSAGVMHLPGALERLHSHNPEARLLFMLREPVARMYSAYWFARRTGDETMTSFQEAVEREGSRTDVRPERRSRTDYRRRSEYVGPLRQARELFGSERVHVVLLEDYSRDRDRVLTDVQACLGLAREALATTTDAVRNEAVATSSGRVARMARGTSLLTRTAKHVVPPAARHRVRKRLLRATEQPLTIPPLDAALRHDLELSFVDHNRDLARDLGLDLSAWEPR